MTRIILEFEGNKDVVEALFQKAVDDGTVDLRAYRFKENVQEKSLVDNWTEMAASVNSICGVSNVKT